MGRRPGHRASLRRAADDGKAPAAQPCRLETCSLEAELLPQLYIALAPFHAPWLRKGAIAAELQRAAVLV